MNRYSVVLALLLVSGPLAAAPPSTSRPVERRVALAAPLVAAVRIDWQGTPGTALAEGGKDVHGRVIFVPAGDGDAVEVAAGLDGLRALAALDTNGDGRADRLLAGWEGGIWSIGPAGATVVLEGDGVDLRSAPQVSTASAPAQLVLARSGRVERYRWDGKSLVRDSSIATPQRLQPTAWGFELSAAPTRVLADDPAGRVVVGPLERGAGRLESVVVAADGTHETVWSLLPSGFRVTSSRSLLLGNSPVLLVGGATKIGVFVDQEILVFGLVSDPSRHGFGPLARLETPCALWNEPELNLRYAGGRAELVVSCPKGVTGGDFWVGAWEVGVGGRPKNLRQVDLDLGPDEWSVGADLDADGIGDLVTLSDDGDLAVFAGRERGRPVDKKSRWTWTVAAGESVAGTTKVTVAVGSGDTKVETAPSGSGVFVLESAGTSPLVVAGRFTDSGVGEALLVSFPSR